MQTYEDGTLSNYARNPYAATVEWKDNGNAYGTRPDATTWLSSMTLARVAGTTTTTVPLTTTDPTAEGYVVVTQTADGSSWTVSLPNARGFDSTGHTARYQLTSNSFSAQGSTVPAGTTYAQKYQNATGATTTLLSGGTITNTLTNTTTFSMDVKWRDDGKQATKAARPEATVTLYRYPDGGSYENPTLVAADQVDTQDVAVPGEDGSLTITLTADGSTADATFPVFNEDGVRYLYFAKERIADMAGTTDRYQALRDGTDKGEHGSTKVDDVPGNIVYNGGTVLNRISGTTTVHATKAWVSAARPDVNATVAINLYKPDETDHSKQDLVDTKTLSGFKAEATSQVAEFEVEKYDDQGHPIKYTAQEGSVTDATGDKAGQEWVRVTEGGVTYLVSPEGYRYRQETSQEGLDITVTNTLVGTAKVEIDKVFSGGLIPDTTSATVTYTVYQNDKAIGTVEHTYQETDVDQSGRTPRLTLDDYSDIKVAEGQPTSGTLPRYDASGAQIEYRVVESKVDPASHGDYHYSHIDVMTTAEGTNDQATTGTQDIHERYLDAVAHITNTHEPGGFTLKVNKVWNDDNSHQYRQQVNAELQRYVNGAWTTIASGSVDAHAPYGYIGVGKEYKESYLAWVNAGSSTEAAEGNYRVVETSLGSQGQWQVVTDAEVDADAHPEHTAGLSFVQTDQQNFDVSPTATRAGQSEYEWTLTNTRVGVVKVHVDKAWVDNSNAANTRPQSQSFTITSDQDGSKPLTLKLEAADAADPATGNTTTDANTTDATDANTWSAETGWLPKYDAAGAVIHYTVTEDGITTKDGTDYVASTIDGVSYVSEKDHETGGNGYAVGPNHTGDVDTYTWTNRLVGKVYPTVNIYWKDDAKPTTQAARPDVYTTLYRSLDGGKTLEVVAGSDKDWSISDVNTSWSKVTYAAQPRFDADGREYTYYIGESFTAAAHDPYANTGNYDAQPIASENTFDDTGTSYQPEGASLPAGLTVFPAPFHNDTGLGGTIVNKPQAKVAVTGNKEWMNLPAGFSRSDLTAATFKLRRYTPDKGEKGQTADDATFVAADGTTAESANGAATTTLGSNGRTFRFGGGEDGTEPIFDQYDPDGYRYTYIVTEEDPNTGGIVYDVSNNTDTGLAVTNTYRDDQGLSIKFSKKWDLSRFVGEGDLSVPVTMALVRYVTDESGQAIEATRSDSFCTAGKNGAANAVKINYSDVSAGGTTTLSWSHLAYYAPNGRKYEYRVEESDLPDNCYVVFTGADDKPVTVTPRTVAGRTVYESVVSLGDAPASRDVTIERTSNLTNVYDDKGGLQVRKVWVDPQDAFDLVTRPTSITGTLTRTAAGTTQTLQADGTWKASGTDAYKLTLTKEATAEGQAVTVKPATAADANAITIANAGEATQGGKATWSATLQGLDCHDPNGNEYSYQFTEDPLAGYDMANNGVSNGVAAVEGDQLNVAQVTNTLKITSIQAKKKWMGKSESADILKSEFGNDEVLFLNQLSAIPDSVTFDVEYKKDGSSEWKKLTRTDGTDATGSTTVTLVASKNETDASKNFVTDALTGLPQQVWVETANDGKGAFVGVEYRAVESALDGFAKLEKVDQEATAKSADGASYVTTVTNALPVKQITVRKTWDDDSNRDRTRPTSLALTVTRTGITSATDTDTATVTLTQADKVAVDGLTPSYTVSTGNSQIKYGSVWQKSVYVPVFWNSSATGAVERSSYAVSEDLTGTGANGKNLTGDNGSYTAFKTSVDDGTYQTDALAAPAAVDLGASGARANFVNISPKEKRDVFSIQPTKTWTYGNKSWPATAADNTSVTVDAQVQPYLEAMNDKLAFELRYWVENTSAHTTDGVPTSQKNAKPVSDQALKDMARGGANDATWTPVHVATVDKTTGAITIDAWTNMPVRWYNGDENSSSDPIHYILVEGTKSGDTFMPANNADETALWTVTSPQGGVTGSANATVQPAFSNALRTATATVAKQWQDSGNAYGSRPDAVVYQLQYKTDNGTATNVPASWIDASHVTAAATGATASVDATNGAITVTATGTDKSAADNADTFKATVSDLPTADASGNAYTYSFVETGLVYGTGENARTVTVGASTEPYKSDATSAASGSAITNQLATISYKVTKSWVDANNLHDGVASVTVRLQHSTDGATWTDVTNGSGAATTATLTSTGWSHTWDSLPTKDGVTGNTWHYRAIETGYDTTGKAHVNMTFAQADGSTDQTHGTIGAYTYTYAADTPAKDATQSGTITNTLRTAPIKVQKAWQDANDQDDIRPDSLTVRMTAKANNKAVQTGAAAQTTLYATGSNGQGGTTTNEVSTDGNTWTDTTTWSAVPTHDLAGNPISYTFTEDAFTHDDLYTKGGPSTVTPASVASPDVATATITNAHAPSTTSVTAKKTWSDGSNKYASRPTQVTYTLQYKYGNEGWKAADATILGDTQQATQTVTLANTAAGTAQYQWTNLPVYRTRSYGQDAQIISYQVVETEVKGYTTSYTNEAVSGRVTNDVQNLDYAITNTLQTTSHSIEKSWSDNYDLYQGVTSVQVKLQHSSDYGTTWSYVKGSNGSDFVATVAAGTNSTWTLTLSDLPAKDLNGNNWTYRAVEYAYVAGDRTVQAHPTDTASPATGTVGAYSYATNWTDTKTTVTNTLQTGSLNVSKTWADANNQDGIRPDSLQVTLSAKAGGTDYTLPTSVNESLTLTGTTWSGSFTNLPLYDLSGTAISYTATEGDVPEGYAKTVGSGSATPGDAANHAGSVGLTNTHTPATVKVVATKAWQDGNDRYGNRPDKITFRLQRQVAGSNDWTEVGNSAKELTVASANNGQVSTTWENLPAFQNGKQVTYRVVEDSVKGYQAAQYGTTNAATGTATDGANQTTSVTVTNQLDTTSYSVSKVWRDANGLYQGVSAVQVKLQHSTDGTTWTDVQNGDATINKANGATWTHSWTDLPKTDTQGKTWRYRAVETGYVTTANAHVDMNFAQADGSTDQTHGTIGAYTYTYAADTPAKDATQSGTITNTLRTAPIKVQKAWQDANNQDAVRPTSITVDMSAKVGNVAFQTNAPAQATLSFSGVSQDVTNPTGNQVSDGGNTWTDTGTWASVPVADLAGNPITYTFTEETFANDALYSKDVRQAASIIPGPNAVAVITNSHTPSTTKVTATKTWSDGDNKYASRPNQVTYTLQYKYGTEGWKDADATVLSQGQTATQTVTVANDAAGAATYTWTGLPVYRARTANDPARIISYRVVESAVNGYTTSYAHEAVTGSVGNTELNVDYAITNALDTTSYSVRKAWTGDYGMHDGISSVQVKLQHSSDNGASWSDVQNGTADIAKPQMGDWTHTWTDLPTKDLQGNEWHYRAVETGYMVDGQQVAVTPTENDPTSGTVGAYAYSYAADTTPQGAGQSGAITNALRTGSVQVTKEWVDANNQDGIRPQSLAVTLTAKVGEDGFILPNGATTSLTLETDNWSKSYTSLPLYDLKGNQISYTATEGDVPQGYTKTTPAGSATPATAQNQAGVVTLKNTHVPATVKVSATKVWQS